MKLYYFHVAPNPTRVRIYLREKGVEIEEELVSLIEGQQKSPEHLARDPFGALPVLEIEDGTYVTESTAIMEYIEETHPEPPMLGRTPEARAHARALDRVADLRVLIATARVVHATRSPLGLPANDAVADQARGTLPATFAWLDARLARQPFLCGEAPTMADCTMWAGLNFGKFFGVELDPQYANIVRWFETFGQRPSVLTL